MERRVKEANFVLPVDEVAYSNCQDFRKLIKTYFVQTGFGFKQISYNLQNNSNFKLYRITN